MEQVVGGQGWSGDGALHCHPWALLLVEGWGGGEVWPPSTAEGTGGPEGPASQPKLCEPGIQDLAPFDPKI